MELTSDEYLARLEKEGVKQATDEVTGSKMKKVGTIKEGLTFVNEAVASGDLAQYTWTVKTNGKPIEIRVETNLINVPMKDAKRLNPKLLEKDKAYPVKVYLVIEGEKINQSGLRIDEVDDNLAPASWVEDQLTSAADYRKEHK